MEEGYGGIVDFFQATDARAQENALEHEHFGAKDGDNLTYRPLFMMFFLRMPSCVVECLLGSSHSILHILWHLPLFLVDLSIILKDRLGGLHLCSASHSPATLRLVSCRLAPSLLLGIVVDRTQDPIAS